MCVFDRTLSNLMMDAVEQQPKALSESAQSSGESSGRCFLAEKRQMQTTPDGVEFN
jgi:hypothetical protein